VTVSMKTGVDASEQQRIVEQFLVLLDKDIEEGQSIGDLPVALEQSMLARLGRPLDPEPIRDATEI
jgi:hypothetical protein